jgi:hypothetical protein
MNINEASMKDKEFPIKDFEENKENINNNIINIRNKKIQEEIKDIIIDKYRTKIITQQKEIERLKKKLEETIKTSLIILKNSFNYNQNNNNKIATTNQKKKIKNDILKINNTNGGVDMIANLSNINKKKNLSYCTLSKDNIKLKKSNTQISELTTEWKKSQEKNNLSLSSSRIKLNKYDIITPKRVKIEKINIKSKSKSKSKTKNKKEGESTRYTINNIDINDLNTYYLKEYNKKDYQKIEGIKIKLLNNNLPDCPKIQKNKNNKHNLYKYYSQNKYKLNKKQNLADKSNNYSYGKNNLKNVFNSPKNIKNVNNNEKNKLFNECYIKKNQINRKLKDKLDNKCNIDNNNHYINPIYNTKNIIHRNININNNNNKIYINTNNSNLNNAYNNHFRTQTNFFQNKIINRPDNQLSINYKDYKEIMLTTPNEYNLNNQ